MRADAAGSRYLTRAGAERRAALRVVGVQALIALGLAGLAALAGGKMAAISALVGGAVAVVATLFFVFALFRHPDGTPAGRVAWGFFLGQGLKVAVTIGLLYVAFRVRGVVPAALLAGYAATYMAYWFMPRGPASRWR
jgi:ATP synthase protein I